MVGLQGNGSGTSPLLSAALPSVAQQTTRDMINFIYENSSGIILNQTDHIPEPLGQIVKDTATVEISIMRKQIQIGELIFNTKKDALSHYKKILNDYDFGEKLNIDDYNDVYNLLKTHKNATKKIGVGLREIRVDKITYRTKCFQVIRTDMSVEFFSYIKCINGKTPPFTKFSKVCREVVKEDIREVKLTYFKKFSSKGRVKCQETGDLCLWDELTVDHRQPNTFSIIVDRFIEVNKIDIEKVEYLDNDIYGSKFKDPSLIIEFQKYHKNKANLRIVKRNKNQGRAYQGRVTRQKKDLTID